MKIHLAFYLLFGSICLGFVGCNKSTPKITPTFTPQISSTPTIQMIIKPSITPKGPASNSGRILYQVLEYVNPSTAAISNIFSMNPNGSDKKKLTYSGKDSGARWSPDGKQIIFESQRDGNFEIYIMIADGSNQKNLTNSEFIDRYPTWSPDGKHIAFLSTRELFDETNMGFETTYNLYLMNPDGNEIIKVNPEKKEMNSPSYSWSPYGEEIVFSSLQSDGSHLYIVPINRNSNIKLLSSHKEIYFPHWSPSGDTIIFEFAENRFVGGVHKINLDGSGEEPFLVFPEYAFTEDYIWLPNGKKIVFDCDNDLCLANSDGSNPINLTRKFRSNIGTLFSPIWSADGNWIIFTAYPTYSSYTKIDYIRGHRIFSDIYLIPVDGTYLLNLTNTQDLEEIDYDWTP